MPTDVETRLQGILEQVVAVSERIRHSSSKYVNGQNLCVFERLGHRLETIRVSANTILGAYIRASLTNDTLDDRLIDWLVGGGPRSCLDRLEEMDKMLKPVGRSRLTQAAAQPPRPAQDKLAALMVVFDNHKGLFHFLLTSDVWNRQNLLLRTPQFNSLQQDPAENQISSPIETETEYETASEHDRDEGSSLLAVETIAATDKKRLPIHIRQKLDEVSRWLAPFECAGRHNDMLKLRQEGTSRWLFDTEEFKKWKTYGKRFLWLCGKAGCGKSVIAWVQSIPSYIRVFADAYSASTIEYLRNSLKIDEVLAFFYCDFRNERTTSSTEVMRSVLSQLVCHVRDCGIDPGDLPNEILEQKSEGLLSLGDLDKLCDLISRFARRFRYEPFIVIDALDECTDIESLLGAVIALEDVRLLVTSRPHQSITRCFTGRRSLSFESMIRELGADISLHVRREIESHDLLRSAGEAMRREINTELNRRAEGRFRWVQCQVDAVKRCGTMQKLREVLDNLPNELELSYERILGEIDERRTEGLLVRHALAWVMVALEPLRLAQIVDGLLVVSKEEKVGRESLRAELLHALSSLVLHNEETDVLILSHYSVKEYLTSNTTLPMYQVIPHEAHAAVAQMCMHFISLFLEAGPSQRSVDPLQTFPVLSYVLSSGLSHLAHVDPGSVAVLRTLQLLGSNVHCHPSHWTLLCELREKVLRWPYPPWPSSRHDFVPYVLIAYSSPGLLQLFLSSSCHMKPRVKTNPLVYAADLRKTEHARVLLTYGADMNAHGLVVDDSRHASTLDIAIDLGLDDLVGELLQKGCLLTSEVLTTAICMPWCSTRVLVKLMQTGGFEKWAHDIGEEKMLRSVFNSARPGSGDSKKTDQDHVSLARILCNIGFNLSANTRFGSELVERAIHAAHTSMLEFLLPLDQPPPSQCLITALTGDTSETVLMVRFLLQREVDIHVVSDGHRDTALHLAVMCPWEPRSLELTKILVVAGCNPTSRNSEGQTPFEVAIERGYTSVVEHLLSYNLRLPSEILSAALRKRLAPQIVDVLIDKSANLCSATSASHALFHLAIAEYPDESTCLHFVRRFIEAGCNPSVRDSKGQTVLEAAIRHGYTSVVEYLVFHDVSLPSEIIPIALQERLDTSTVEFLIKKGAELNDSITSDGNTIFHLAITKYPPPTCLDWVKKFIKAGCKPSACDSTRQSVLEAAVRRGYNSVVELLLSHDDVFLPPKILPIAVEYCLDPQTVLLLVEKGADLSTTMSNGNTILHLAINAYSDESRCLELVKRIIDAGCNPSAFNSVGQTVLEFAIKSGNNSMVELLLSHNVILPPEILPIALQECLAPQMVEILLEKCVDQQSITYNGNSIFHLAINGYTEPTCLKWVTQFIGAGCNLDVRNTGGQTVLEAAIKRGYALVVGLLLSCGAFLPPQILSLALRERLAPQAVEILIQKGADLHATTPDGNTILHLAITEYSDESTCLGWVKRFIEAGCSPTVRDSKDQTVLEAAVKCGFTSVVELLLSYNVSLPSTILPVALRERSAPQMIEFLIEKGADLHSTSDGNTILHLAITEYPESTCLDWIKKFIGAGCNPGARNSNGRTVLEAAVKRGYTLVVDLLLTFNVILPLGILPVALRERVVPQMIEFLIEKGANLLATTSDRNTTLHLVITKYSDESVCLEWVKRFIEAGCSPAARNSDGQTVLEAAIQSGSTSVVGLLLSYDVVFPPDVLPVALREHSTPQMVEFLIEKGANLQSVASNGNTIHHLAITEYSQLHCLNLVKKFIKAGRNATTRSPDGDTVLEAAIRREYTSVVEYLLLQCDLWFPSDVLSRALEWRLSLRTIQFLIHKGADVRFIAPSGGTLLHLALEWQDPKVRLDLMKTFVEAGCDTAVSDFGGQTVLEAAIAQGHISIVKLLLSYTAFPPSDLLMLLKRRFIPDMDRSWIPKTASDVDAVLLLAMGEYDVSTCIDLITSLIGAGLDLASCTSKGITTVEVAVRRGLPSIVELLLQNNVPLSPTALTIALIRYSDPLIIHHLVRRIVDDRAKSGKVARSRITTSGYDWDGLISMAQTSYINRRKLPEVIKMLEGASRAG